MPRNYMNNVCPGPGYSRAEFGEPGFDYGKPTSADAHVRYFDHVLLMERAGPGIVTEYVYPPIPERQWDWAAYRDNYDGAPDSHCIVGRGPTEDAAVEDLLEQEANK